MRERHGRENHLEECVIMWQMKKNEYIKIKMYMQHPCPSLCYFCLVCFCNNNNGVDAMMVLVVVMLITDDEVNTILLMMIDAW